MILHRRKRIAKFILFLIPIYIFGQKFQKENLASVKPGLTLLRNKTLAATTSLTKRSNVSDWIANHRYFEYDFKDEVRDVNQTCYIQRHQPFDPLLLAHVKKLPPLKCGPEIQLTYINDDGFLKFDEEGLRKSGRSRGSMRCMYAEILRYTAYRKDTFIDNKLKPFNGLVDVRHCDFIRVKCNDLNNIEIYHNLHLHIRDFPNESFKMDDKKYNVLLFGMDSMSRMQAMRQIPRTYAYLKDDLDAFILRGYNKVGRNTFPNIGSLLTGVNPYDEPPPYRPTRDELKPYDPWPFMWKNFSANGYRTMFAEEDPMYNAFHYLAGGFHQQPTDHYCRPFWDAVEQRAAFTKDVKYCYRNTPKHKLLMAYSYGLVKKLYGKVPFWAFSYITEISHGHPNTVGMADDDIHEYLEKIYTNKFFDNTFFVYFSDHGERYDPIRLTRPGSLEDKMPLLAIRPPKRFRESQPQAIENLKENEKRLTNAYDVYCTLMDVLKLSLNPKHEVGHFKSKKGLSLFGKIPQNRTCKSAGIVDEFCACLTEEAVPVDSILARNGAKVLVNKINAMLSSNDKASDLCAELKLSSIEDANLVFETIAEKGTKLKLKFRTAPSDGLFEGVVTVSGKNKQHLDASDNIDRVNRYGNQSICIDDKILREFCYCL